MSVEDKRVAAEPPDSQTDDDGQLVDLVAEVLVDPNLHTDLRMRLGQEISALVRETHEQLYGSSGHEVHRRRLEAHGDHLPSFVEAVLADPNLHTDLRMRLHRELSALLRAAASARTSSREAGSTRRRE